jgi:hypothetical protein
MPSGIPKLGSAKGRKVGCNTDSGAPLSGEALRSRQATSDFNMLNSLSGPVAQRLEQQTHNLLVVGSNPTGPTSISGNNPIKR